MELYYLEIRNLEKFLTRRLPMTQDLFIIRMATWGKYSIFVLQFPYIQQMALKMLIFSPIAAISNGKIEQGWVGHGILGRAASKLNLAIEVGQIPEEPESGCIGGGELPRSKATDRVQTEWSQE